MKGWHGWDGMIVSDVRTEVGGCLLYSYISST